MNKNYCVIVGAGNGVSMGVARRFARAGTDIVLLSRTADRLQALKEDLAANNVTVHTYVMDAADPASISATFANIIANHGVPTVLHYNAAAIHEGEPSTMTADTMLQDFKVNVVGALMCAQQVIPAMQARQSGSLLFTGGGLALNPHPNYSSLALGKAAMRNLVFSLHAELKPHNIYVGTVTIAGYVQPDTHFAPDKIAEVFWQLHEQQNEVEIVYR